MKNNIKSLKYEAAEIEVVTLSLYDVIATSTPTSPEGDLDKDAWT